MAIQRHKGLADDVYGAIFNKLMSLEIAPGARITVDGLVRELEVSHTPIREALGRLEGEGLVVKTHLVGYFLRKLEKPQPRRWVKISNQFTQGEQWHLGNPTFLLLPAGKTFANEPPKIPDGQVDHFLCYVVRDGTAKRKSITLEDQFDLKLKRKEKILRIKPAFFGVPVQ